MLLGQKQTVSVESVEGLERPKSHQIVVMSTTIGSATTSVTNVFQAFTVSPTTIKIVVGLAACHSHLLRAFRKYWRSIQVFETFLCLAHVGLLVHLTQLRSCAVAQVPCWFFWRAKLGWFGLMVLYVSELPIETTTQCSTQKNESKNVEQFNSIFVFRSLWQMAMERDIYCIILCFLGLI